MTNYTSIKSIKKALNQFTFDVNKPIDNFEEAKIGHFHFWVENKDGSIYDPCFTDNDYTKIMAKEGNLIHKPIYKEFDKEYVTVENPDWSKVVDAWYSEVGVDIVNDTGYSMETLRANGNSVEKTDRYARIRRKHLPALLEGKDVTLITKLSDSNSAEIVSGREHIEETFMSNMTSEAYEIVDAHKSGKLGTLNWEWVGQLPGEELVMETDNES